MNNAQKGDKILSYDNQQSAEINVNKNKIETVEQGLTTTNQKLTNLDNKLSKDYIVDFGNNNNGNWEKWASGKLVQWGSFVSENMNQDYTKTIPIKFVGENIEQTILLTAERAGGYNNIFVQSKGFATSKQAFLYRVSTTASTTTGTIINWDFKGRWK